MAVFRTGQGLAANVLSLKNGGWKTRFLIAFSVLRIYYATFAGSCQPKSQKVALCGVCGVRRWGDAAPAAGAKRKGHLRFPFLFELLSFPYSDSTAAIRERRPLRNRGTAVGLLLRRNAHYASITRPIRSSRMPFCYTYRQLYADATQGELPEGQEKVPWGITVSRNSFVRYFA